MNVSKANRTSSAWKAILAVWMVILAVSIVPIGMVQSQDAGEDLDLGNLSPEVPVPTEPVTVTFASWVGGNPDWQLMKQQFEELYPNITIEFQDIPFEEMRTSLLTRLGANNPPDAAYIDLSTTGELAVRGALASLDDYIAKSQAVDIEDYVPAFLDVATYQDSIYGLPIRAETTGLFYRTDLFEEAGIEHPPTTWEEFLEAAERLTDPSKQQYGVAIFAPEAAYYWYPWLWQAGGDLLATPTDVIFDSEAGQRAAEFYVNLAQYSPPDLLQSNSWDGRVAFAQGNVAMYIAGAWFAGTLSSEFPEAEGLWATAPLPTDQRCATTIAGDALVIFEQSENKDAAWKWIEFVSAPENMRFLNLGTAEAPTTLLPPRRSLLEDPATFEGNPVMQGFSSMMECAVFSEVQQPRWGEIEQILNEQLARAIYGEIDAVTAVQEAAAEAEALVAE